MAKKDGEKPEAGPEAETSPGRRGFPRKTKKCPCAGWISNRASFTGWHRGGAEMAASGVNGAGEPAYAGAAGEALRKTQNELGKDAFLKILIAQLSNQDPLDPLKDKDFIAQMAQFSTLEQMTNMNKSIDQMNAVARGSSVNYIGRVIEFEDDDGLSAFGTVAFVKFEKSGVILTTTEEKEVPLQKVLAVA